MALMAPGSWVTSHIPRPQPDLKSGHFSRHVFWHPTPEGDLFLAPRVPDKGLLRTWLCGLRNTAQCL